MATITKRVLAGCAVWLLVVACAWSVPSAVAGEIRLGNIVPGTGFVRKQMLSARELRFTDLVRQQTDFSCGAAATATVLRYAYGRDVDETDVLMGMLEVADKKIVVEKGFSLLDIKKYAERQGMQGLGLQIDPKQLDQLKIPTITLIDINGYKHFVVLKKANDDRVYVADPALGNTIMKREAFEAAWNGIILAIVGNDFDADTVLLQPAEPLSARRLLAGSAPYLPARTIGFGTEHTNMLRF